MKDRQHDKAPHDDGALPDDPSALSDDDLRRLLVEDGAVAEGRPDDNRCDDVPAPEQGTWIVRRPRHRGRRSVQADLPQRDLFRDYDINPDDLTDEQFQRLLSGDDDIELADLSSVEDEQPMTAEERAGLDRALQELVRALEQAIDEMIPDDEDADDADDAG